MMRLNKRFMVRIIGIRILMYTGWWYTYPSEKYEFVSWDDYSQYIWKNKTCSKPPTIMYVYVYIYIHILVELRCFTKLNISETCGYVGDSPSTYHHSSDITVRSFFLKFLQTYVISTLIYIYINLLGKL